MSNYRSTRQTNINVSQPLNTSQKQIKIETKAQPSFEHPSNVSYHSIKYTKKSSETKDSQPKNNPINTIQYKNVSTTQKINPPKESVKITSYTSYTTSGNSKPEITNKHIEINTNQNKEHSKINSTSFSQVPSAYKRSSYFVAPKENTLKENI